MKMHVSEEVEEIPVNFLKHIHVMLRYIIDRATVYCHLRPEVS